MGPLEAFSVVDLSERSVASAMACMMFADYGAHVIRVEPADGDPIRELPGSRVWLRGQSSVTVGEGGLDKGELLALCRSADVVIDTAQAWTAKTFLYSQPVPDDQVYCLLTAEPISAEEVAKGARPAGHVYGELTEAKYGYMYIQDGVRRPQPTFIGVPHAAVGAAWLIQLGVLAALFDRLRTGRGQVVTTSLVDACAILNTTRWVGGGQPPLLQWPSHSNFNRLGNSRMILAMLECADGWLQIMTGARGAGNQFFRLLGRDDLADPELDRNPGSLFPSQEIADQFWEEMPKIFKTKTVERWCNDLAEAGVAVVPVLPPGEGLALEQSLAQGLADGNAGFLQFGLAGRFDRTPGQVGRPPSTPGADNNDFRGTSAQEAGSASRANEKGNPRGPLDGVLALDLGHVVIEPFSMRILADLGARVVRIDEKFSVGREPPGHSFGTDRGKESIVVDLKSDEGKDVVYDLVRQADVFGHNKRVGAMDRLGLGWQTLRELNDRLVYCHSSGYGNHGPWASRPVFGAMPDALSGAFVRAGGVENPPQHTVSHVDFGGALNSAALVLAALIERERSGQGQFLETAQLGASFFWMSDAYLENGEVVQTFNLDPEQRGHAPTNALYRTRDGWIVVACYSDSEWTALHTALGIEVRESYAQVRGRLFADSDATGPLARALEAQSTADALSHLGRAGVGAAEPQFLVAETLPGGELEENGPIVSYTHPWKGWIFDVGRPLRFSLAPDDSPRRPPVAGEHTRAILEELGFSPKKVEALIENGVAVQGRIPSPEDNQKADQATHNFPVSQSVQVADSIQVAG